MTPLWKSLLYLIAGLVTVAIPFALGRWSKAARYCGPCERRMAAADRARANGEAVARLRERSTSPEDVRAQAERDRRERLLLVEQANSSAALGRIDTSEIDRELRDLGVTW